MSKKLEDIELRSEQVQDILSYIPHWMIRYGNLLFLVLIILFLSLSWLIKYPDIITAEVLLRTQVPPEKIFAQASEKIDTILVTDNSKVVENSPLAILKNTSDFRDVYQLKSIMETIKVNAKSFYFPLDKLPVLSLGDIDAKYALFENSYIQYELNKSLQPFSNEALANENTVLELNRRLQNSKQQLDLMRTELKLKKTDLDRSKILYEEGILAKLELEQGQIEYHQAERNIKNFESSISQIRESIGNANKSSKGIKINKIKEEMMLLKSVIQSFNQLLKEVKNWEAKYVLKSNINGEIAFSNNWNINQTVTKGDLVFTIIPTENSAFLAQLKTPATNAGKLKAGQNVNITLENYPKGEFGTLAAKVNHISLVPDKDGKYLVLADLPEKLISSYKKQIEFKQEMRGSAEIITEDLRLIERFFYQLRNVL